MPRPRGTVADAHRQALNRGYVLLPLRGTSPPPGGAGLLPALARASSLGPLPAAVEATTRMTYEQSHAHTAPAPLWERTRAPPLAMFKLPLVRGNPAEVVRNRGADAQDDEQQRPCASPTPTSAYADVPSSMATPTRARLLESRICGSLAPIPASHRGFCTRSKAAFCPSSAEAQSPPCSGMRSS